MTNIYDRRKFLAHSAAAAGGVVTAGALVDQLAAGPAGAAIIKGGTLKVGTIAEQIAPINPPYGHLDTSGFCYARAVYDPLAVSSADGKTVYPYLAQSITHNAAFTQWTITARPNVKFHNGKKCDGDAIYANLHADFVSTLTGFALQALISSITHTPGSNTVVIHTKHKWTTLPYTLAEQQIGFIADPSTLGANYSGNPIGTGPFVCQQWVINQKFVCTKNPQYWRAGLPYLSQIEFHPIVQGSDRFTALTLGNMDMILEAEGAQIKKFATLGSKYTYFTDVKGKLPYSPNSNCIMMNTSKAPFTDLNFRKACAAAIDQKTFAKIIDAGEASPVNGIFLPGSPYYKTPTYPAFNLTQAKAYLNKSAITPANRKFTLTCTNSAIVIEAAELIKEFLAKIGVTVTLNSIQQSQLIDNAISGAYQATSWYQFGGVSPDTNYPWFSTKTFLNFARNKDASIENAMIQGMAATTAAARVKQWAFVNDQIDRDVPYLWLTRQIVGIAASSKVMNWKTFTEPTHGKPVLQPDLGVLFFAEVWKS